MNDLRQKVIRLAHAKPSLRPVLLPLLKQARSKKASHPASDLGYDLVGIIGREMKRRGIVDDYMQGATYENIAWEMAQQARKNPMLMVKVFEPAIKAFAQMYKNAQDKQALLRAPAPGTLPSLVVGLLFAFEGGGMNWDYPELKRYGGEAIVAAQLVNELANDGPYAMRRFPGLMIQVDRKEYRYDQRKHLLKVYVDVFGSMDSASESGVVSAVDDAVSKEIESLVKVDSTRRFENLVYGMAGDFHFRGAVKVEVL